MKRFSVLCCSTLLLVQARIGRPSYSHKLRGSSVGSSQDVVRRPSTAQGFYTPQSLRQLDSKSKASKSRSKSKSKGAKGSCQSKSKSKSKSKSAKSSDDGDCDETEAPIESPTDASTALSTLAPSVAASTFTDTLSPTTSIITTASPTGEGGINITTVPPKNLTFPPTTPPVPSSNNNNPGSGLLPATGGATFTPFETRPPETGNNANRTSIEGANNPGATINPAITNPPQTNVTFNSNVSFAPGGNVTLAPAWTLAPTMRNGTDAPNGTGTVSPGTQAPISGSNQTTTSPLGNVTTLPITITPVSNLTTTAPSAGGSTTAAQTATQAPTAGNTTTPSPNVITPAPLPGGRTVGTPNINATSAPASNLTTAPLATTAPTATISTPTGNLRNNNTPSIQTETNMPASTTRNGNFVGATIAESKNLSFSAELEISFFEGEGKAPTGEEIGALIHETELFFTDLFATASITRDVFQSFHISNVEPTYSEAEDADYFKVTFDATLIIAPGSPVTMDTVSNLVDHADYGDFISGYIWMSAPFKRNEFYQTHGVSFTCHALGVQTERRLSRWWR